MTRKFSPKPTSMPEMIASELRREAQAESEARDAAAREVYNRAKDVEELPISNETALRLFKEMKEARKQASKDHGVSL